MKTSSSERVCNLDVYAPGVATPNLGTRIRLLAAGAGVFVMACGGGGGGGTPTAPAGPPTPQAQTNIAGSYTLTLLASPTCSSQLDPPFRQRSFAAQITQSSLSPQADYVQVTLTGVGPSAGQVSSAAAGSVSGGFLFLLFGVSELLPSALYQVIEGAGEPTPLGQPTISGRMGGHIWVTLLSSSGATTGRQMCSAADHRFTFTRR